MAGLQRSAVSFRRQGSSGLVWDDKFLSGELNKVAQRHETQEQGEKLDRDAAGRPSRSVNTIERSLSNGGQRGFSTGKASAAIEPPSPKLSACGCCSAFGKPPAKNHHKKAIKARSR